MRLWRGTDRMNKNDWIAKGSWVGIGLSLWVIAWVISEAIPVFNSLLSLIVCFSYFHFIPNVTNLETIKTALFASWFTCKYLSVTERSAYRKLIFLAVGLPGIFWLHMNWGNYFSSWRKVCMSILNLLIFGIGCCLVSSAY